MLSIFLGAPIVGILTALAAVVFEQLLAVFANLFSQTEIIQSTYAHLSFFLAAAAVIEESCKYFALSRILRRTFGLRRFRFISAALLVGLFFGLAETYLILLTNGKKISALGSLGGDTLFSLGAVILLHLLTTLLIAIFIASRKNLSKFDALKTIVPPALIHLLFNFLVIQRGNFTNWLVGITLCLTFVVCLVTAASNFRELD